MARIFVCYRRDDSGEHIPSILNSLQELLPPEAIFVDIFALNPGEDFRFRIYQELHDSEILLVIIGSHWARSFQTRQDGTSSAFEDHVRVEIETALRLRKVVIPVILAPAKRPSESELPSTIRDLIRLNTLEISADDPESLERLSKAIRSTLKTSFERRINEIASQIGVNPGAIHFVFEGIRCAENSSGENSTIEAKQIWDGVISHAKSVSGDRWKNQMRRLGIQCSEDVGSIIYSLILAGILERAPADHPADFWRLGEIDKIDPSN